MKQVLKKDAVGKTILRIVPSSCYLFIVFTDNTYVLLAASISTDRTFYHDEFYDPTKHAQYAMEAGVITRAEWDAYVASAVGKRDLEFLDRQRAEYERLKALWGKKDAQ